MQKKHDAGFGVREAVTMLPEQLLSPPYELRGEMNWIDFSGTTNPLGTPSSFIEAIQQALNMGELNYSPDREAHSLRSALARQHGVGVESFLVGTTVSQMVHAVAQTYKPCTVGVSVPGPVEYALATSNAGHHVVNIAGPAGFVVPELAVTDSGEGAFNAAVLSNPGYPTSRLLPRPTLYSYLKECSWVVVDERSIELTLGGESLIPLVKKYRNLVIVRSFCESYAMPGIPISYCVAHPDTITQIQRFYDSSAVPMFAEILGERALTENAYLERTREFLETEIPWLQCMLSLLPGISIFPAEANYVMCAFNHDQNLNLGVQSAEELAGRLQLAGFLIRKLEGTPGLLNGKYFCVAVRTREDNEKLIAALREIIQGD